MKIRLAKRGLDLGIVVCDPERSLAFYRDLLGLEDQGSVDLPGGISTHRLGCGDSVVKLVTLEKGPRAAAAPGGISGANGYRYWTLCVENLDEIADAIDAAGYDILIRPYTPQPGLKVCILEDPEGNWVELAQYD